MKNSSLATSLRYIKFIYISFLKLLFVWLQAAKKKIGLVWHLF